MSSLTKASTSSPSASVWHKSAAALVRFDSFYGIISLVGYRWSGLSSVALAKEAALRSTAACLEHA